jgi:HSP20 family protein
VDISDGEEAIYLSVEVPGIDKDQLKIEVNKRVLTLSGEKQAEKEDKDAGIYRSERVYGAFKRSFTLPDEVDAENIVARTENGVLRITLPKKPEAKPKLISIGNGGSEKIEVS